MSPRDLLGVLVRLGGIAFVIFGIGDLIIAIARLSGVHLNPYHTWQDGMIGGGFWLLIGAGLLCGADHVVKLAYPRN
ncbi:MAG: hypothetical protein KGQ79_00370 [Proteobacteria bacterium]|nr:hypothetical protein [Pseudomonadota bacterium]